MFVRNSIISCIFALATCMFQVQVAPARIVYVDAGAAGANNGSSWLDAHTDLQDALAVAFAGDEVWVAEGTYCPSDRTDPCDPRTATFQLVNAVAIYGGFPSGGGTWASRSPIAHETILTGDLAGNDVPVPDPCQLLHDPTRTENAYHVVFASQVGTTTVLDGFTITAGNAHANVADNDPRLDGGGMYIYYGSPTVSNCKFIANSAADNGGAVFCRYASARITNNRIIGNFAADGAGLWCRESVLTITDNTITGNMASDDGGGIVCGQDAAGTIEGNIIGQNTAQGVGGGIVCRDGASPTVISNSIIANRTEENGGGVYCLDSWPTIMRNTIKANTAEDGAGIWCKDARPTITSNMIIDNEARDDGGGICCRTGSSPTIQNNTVVGNIATTGGGIWCPEDFSVTITNCILWGNTADNVFGCGATYCCIQNYTGGAGNISAYPHFVDPVFGDYHLRSYSPCIDAGDDSVISLGDEDIDGEPLVGRPPVDIGADEATERSSDYDADGLPDDWERLYFKDILATPDGDPDGDGLTNLQEYHAGSYPAPGVVTAYVSVDNHGDPLADGSIAHPFGRISDGIAASFANVVVAQGTYYERIAIDSKTLHIRGGYSPDFSEQDPQKYSSIINANGHGSCVTYHLAPGGTLEGFTITGGYYEFFGCGGGIYCKNSSPTITRNMIVKNVAFDGGGIYCTGISSPTIVNSIIANNVSHDDGGAIFCDDDTAPIIINNTVVSNRSDPSGGGIHCKDEAAPTITNCILWDNGDELYQCTADYSCIQDVENEGVGNTWLYPHFINPSAGDYHLQSYSPCLDAGYDSAVGPGTRDIDGENRIQLSHVDMGADEVPAKSGDFDGDGLPDDWELEHFGNTGAGPNDDVDSDGLTNLQEYQDGTDPAAGEGRRVVAYVNIANAGDPQADGSHQHPFGSIQQGIDVATQQVLVAGGRYFENVVIDSKELDIAGGYDPTFTHCDPGLYPTILDANGVGRAVTYLDAHGGLIAGFTVTGGNTRDGGGIYCAGSSPTISNNIIVANEAQDDGGGIYCKNDPSPTISGNVIRGNKAWDNGGGIYCRNTSTIITNNVITGNISNDGAGIWCRASASAITNNTIVGNIAEDTAGGIYSWGRMDNKDVTIANCIVWGNTAGNDGPQIGLGKYDANSTPAISYCVVEGGKRSIYAETGCWPIWGPGNVDVDPALTADRHLRRSSPCIDAGTSSGAPALDCDGEARPQGLDVDIGSDEFVDYDGDGLPNWWESKYFASPGAGNPYVDSDGDGLTNLQEYEDYSSHPTAAPLRVYPSGGPFQKIQEAIDAAKDGDAVLVYPGTYAGPGNRNLDFRGKHIILRAVAGPALTIIDCEGSGRGFYFHCREGSTAAVVGFTITNGQADRGGAILCERSSPQICYCMVTGNNDRGFAVGGIGCFQSMPTLANCIIRDNWPDGLRMETGGARIVGSVELRADDWIGDSVVLNGDGTIHLQSDALLHLRNSRIRCNLSGAGAVWVNVDSKLVIEGDAIIDLGHETDPNLNGTIQCDGLLIVKDSVHLRNARVNISRASFQGYADISNSVITAEAASPYGQFFIEDTVHIVGNDIHADGDRFMDLDPSVFDGVIALNRIYVTITEGVGQSRGGLLELRGAPDLASGILCDPNNEFICHANSIPGFDPNTWTIEELRLISGAKVNLTNRFDFQPPHDSDGAYEALYVKRLILGENSVLNTAFNHIYYHTLEKHPAAKVTNEPLLGFSLNNIAFDDKDDFISRVRHNNFIDPTPKPRDDSRRHIERIVGFPPDPAGMMRMRSLMDRDPQSPQYQQVFNARAQGLFAKATEDEVLVIFEYLFCTSDPNVRLVVYLTDSPELLDPNDPARADRYVEVGRLAPPPPGRPGSQGSGRFGVFHSYIGRGHLNFIKGTRIELELIGPDGACVFINNWDPQVHCSGFYCGDVTGDLGATVLDFLTVVAHVGCVTGLVPGGSESLVCLEFGWSADGVVDSLDVAAWSWRLSLSDPLNLCDVSFPSGAPSPPAPAETSEGLGRPRMSSSGLSSGSLDAVLISAKRGSSDADAKLEDRLYVFDAQGQYVDSFPPPEPNDTVNTRLLSDPCRGVYQINVANGLVRLSDGKCVLPPATFSVDTDPRYNTNAEVLVGLRPEGLSWVGRPILDAAFDGQGFLYVVPVVVNPDSNEAYEAAAKLQLLETENPPYRVVRLYDDPPPAGDNQYRNNLREIEVDRAGNLYVANSDTLNESDVLWVFDGDTGVVKKRVDLGNPTGDTYLPAPVAMHASSTTNMLYLASSRNDSGAHCVSLSALSTDDFTLTRTIEINGMGHITDITENPSTGTLWVVGFTMLNIPEYLEPYGDPFYWPYLAQIPCDSNEPVHAVSLWSPDHDLALPLSILWTGAEPCAEVDLDHSGQVNLVDFALFADYWLGPACGGCGGAELTGDEKVTADDLRMFCNCWLWPNP